MGRLFTVCVPERRVCGEDTKSLEGFLCGRHLVEPREEDPFVVAGVTGLRAQRSSRTPLDQLLSLQSQQGPESCGTRCQHRLIFTWKTVSTNKL